MAKAVVKVAPKSKPAPQLPASLTAELERRRVGLARHMARAVVAVVKWDDSTGVPPQREAIAKACEAGLDLFLATAREARPATPEELRRVAQLGILQARSSQSVEPVLAAYRIAARVAWDAILRAWRGHPEATPEAIMVTANYVFAALDQVAAEVTKTYLHAREQHMQRGTRARARLFHALISDNFDSELELQKQALALNMPIAATGYIATVSKLIVGNREGDRGGERGKRQEDADECSRIGAPRPPQGAGGVQSRDGHRVWGVPFAWSAPPWRSSGDARQWWLRPSFTVGPVPVNSFVKSMSRLFAFLGDEAMRRVSR